MKKLFDRYIDAYRGLSPAAWMLALTILINRSGSMMLAFLGLYLKATQDMGLQEIGIVLAMYGVGSAFGSILGGLLTDRFGAFHVQFGSLLLGGLGFIGFSFLQGFWPLAIGTALLSTITESLRPANISAIASYAKPENITRAISLNRMAINLGFAVGPALGGLLATVHFQSIFWFDGITCLLASWVFYRYFRHREARKPKGNKGDELRRMQAVFRDTRYLRFIGYCMLYAFLFFQIFNSFPLFMKEVGQLPEKTIGVLFALNGIIVFILEMPLVDALTRRVGVRLSVVLGFVLAGLAFACLLAPPSMLWFTMSVALLSLSEIAALPFATTRATEFTTAENRGSYMGIYGLGYSITHFLAPSLSLSMAAGMGYQGLWIALTLLGLGIPIVVLLQRPKPKQTETAAG